MNANMLASKMQKQCLELYSIDCLKHKCKLITTTNYKKGELSMRANQNVE